MADWLLNLPVPGMAIAILAAIYFATWLVYAVIARLAVGPRAQAFKSISAGMLSPLAVIFALLVGFFGAQVWNDADRANQAVNREASALRAVVLLGTGLPPEIDAQVRKLVRVYIEDAVGQEWPVMARRGATLTLAPAHLVQVLQRARSGDPHGPGQVKAQAEMVSAVELALDARRQRILLSRSSINWVKWVVLILQAGITMVAIAMVHSENRLGMKIIMGLFASSVGIAMLLLAAHTRPFTGEISVSPAVLLQVMPEAPGSRGPPN